MLSQFAPQGWDWEFCTESLGRRKNALICISGNAGVGYKLYHHVPDGAKERALGKPLMDAMGQQAGIRFGSQQEEPSRSYRNWQSNLRSEPN
ncbi:hypothetical protein [Neorhodopirellula lusitana]|uniref:hypothetical protein n=1 Tax=Neorhodopirellula lusitana TaxID=445327 RepID=UPI00384B7797